MDGGPSFDASEDGPSGDAETDAPPDEPCPEEMILIDAEGARPFCIDRYEHPNVEGSLPTTGLPWHLANAACVDELKSLCLGEQWAQACAGTPSDACGGALAPSGSRDECQSAAGVFDLPGNVAEWVAEPGGSVSWYAFGGSATSVSVSCEEREEIAAEARRSDVGFRCCRQARR